MDERLQNLLLPENACNMPDEAACSTPQQMRAVVLKAIVGSGSTQEEVGAIVKASMDDKKISGNERSVAWDGQTRSGPGLQNQMNAIAEDKASLLLLWPYCLMCVASNLHIQVFPSQGFGW